MVINKKLSGIHFDGCRLCFDFTNTVHDRTVTPYPDYLFHILDLVTWARKIGILNAKSERALMAYSQDHPAAAGRFFSEAIETREVMYRMFHAWAEDKKINDSDLQQFNEICAVYRPLLLLKQTGKTITEEWNIPDDSLKLILAPVIRDAMGMLLQGKPERVKDCPTCGWMFYDTTKSATRRWCNMEVCGSRHKAREWYKRKIRQH